MYSQSYFFLFTYFLSIVMCHLLLKRHTDFRERFLERKKERQLKSQRIMVLDNYVLKGIESLDDIIHYRQIENSSSLSWDKIKSIETDFRRLLSMDGMKYNYKRDLYWRTWRSVSSGTGVNKLVCYKCNNPIQVNASTGSQNCGMWTIEERPPPCPYEFFSVIDDQKLCGANYTQYNEINNTCPSEIKFTDLTATCDNPIETVWRFNKLYGVPEKKGNIICGGKDFCEIFTSYEISPEHVIFRIINSTNDVMYSRIMKPNNTNYICIDDCGRFNPNTRKVTKNDKPLKLDLLSARITKRDVFFGEKVDEHLPTESNLKKSTLSKSKDGANSVFKQKMWSKVKKKHRSTLDFYDNLIEQFMTSLEGHTLPKTSFSNCTNCQKLEREADHVSYEEENEEYD